MSEIGCEVSTSSPASPRPRSCAIAARLGEELTCPDGGCRLARELGMVPDADGLWPCPLEVLALRAPESRLTIVTIDGLRRTLERGPRWGRERRLREERARRPVPDAVAAPA